MEMRNGAVRTLLLVALLLQCSAASVHASPGADDEPWYDSTLLEMVSGGDRLDLRNYSGKVHVRVGEPDRIRVRARHATRDRVELRRRRGVLTVIPVTWAKGSTSFEVRPPDVGVVRVVGRAPGAVDIEVTVPRWLPLSIEGPMVDVVVDGTEAPIEVTVMTGGIRVRGGRVRVALTTMSGSIALYNAHGRITVAGGVGRMTLHECRGDVRVETTSGDVQLEAVTADHVEITTLGGDVTDRGAITGGSRWNVSTHSGDVTLELGGEPDARFRVRALRGEIVTDLVESIEDSRHLDLVVGGGSADVRLTTFSGTIRIEKGSPAERRP